VNSTVLLTVLN